MNKPLARFATLLALVLVSACGSGGGGGGSSIPPPGPSPTPTPGGVKTAAVNIVLNVSGLAPGARARSPRFVSPATANVTVSINGGTPQTFAGGGTPCSSPPNNVGVSGCTVITVNAPLGTDTFAVTLLDAANVVLSQGTTQATIVADATNTVNIVFNGVAAGVTIHLADATPPTGAVAHIPLSLLPVDAHGYSLVGAPGTLPDITVTDSDQSGVTGLYLAPDSGACPAGTGGLTRTITTTQTGAFYKTVCVVYTGGSLPNGATFTATISGAPSSSTILSPVTQGATPSGVWAYGNAPSGPLSLVRFDTSFNAVQTISGSSTTFGGSAPTPVGITTEPGSGNVEMVQPSPGGGASTYIDATYAGTATGNVAPTAVTTFTLPAGWTANGPAVNGDGNLYVVGVGPPGTNSTPQACQIYRLALNGATSSPTGIYDCTNTAIGFGPLTGYGTALTSFPVLLRFDSQSRLYLGDSHPNGTFSNFVLYTGTIFRFSNKPDGSLQPDSSISPGMLYDFGFKSNEDVVVNVLRPGQTWVYPSSSFQDGRTNGSPSASDGYNAQGGAYGAPIAVDPSDDVWMTDPSQTVKLVFYPPGSHIANVDANFAPQLLAPVTTAASSSGPAIHATPNAVEVPGGSNTITVSESGYTGQFTETDNCAGKASISPHSAPGPSATFTVTASGTQGGTCSAQFSDASNHMVQVQVGSTATTIMGSSKRRR